MLSLITPNPMQLILFCARSRRPSLMVGTDSNTESQLLMGPRIVLILKTLGGNAHAENELFINHNHNYDLKFKIIYSFHL